jgi:hypothetical protein
VKARQLSDIYGSGLLPMHRASGLSALKSDAFKKLAPLAQVLQLSQGQSWKTECLEE